MRSIWLARMVSCQASSAVGTDLRSPHSVLQAPRHDSGDVGGLLAQGVGDVDGQGRPPSVPVDEEVREAAGHEPMDGLDLLGPVIPEGPTVAADDLVVAGQEGRQDGVEAGGVDDAVELVLVPCDTMPFSVIRSTPWPWVSIRCTLGWLKTWRNSSL